MNNKSTISFVFNANLPFVRAGAPRFTFAELPFFETISLSFIPLLKMAERLEQKNISYRFGLSVSPLLCHLLNDELLIKRYLKYVDNQIAFGESEVKRLKNKAVMKKLAETYLETMVSDRKLFTEKFKGNIIGALAGYVHKGRIELLNTTAVEVVLPFFINYPSAISALIETALITHRKFFKQRAQGFWLPEMAYCRKIDELLSLYNFGWTILDTHSALLAAPAPLYGSFYPAKTNRGLLFLTRDFYACNDLAGAEGLLDDPVFRSYVDDIIYDLPLKDISEFISADGARLATGYRYYTKSREVYNPALAVKRAKEKAELFLEKRLSSLTQAGILINENFAKDFSGRKHRRSPVSLCCVPLDFIGRFRAEGFTFLEEVFTQAAEMDEIQIINPSEYLYRENTGDFQTITPEYSSAGMNGYMESFLDSSNAWIYKYLLRSIERMINLSERSERSSDLWDRVLNQGARELFLASGSVLARLLSTETRPVPYNWKKFADESIKRHLRNFTTFYEALGGSGISTKFLIELEQEDNVFPDLNYHSFRRRTAKTA